jgi:hypothetical protein
VAARHRLRTWIGGILLAVLTAGPCGLALICWLRVKSMENADVPLAIYDTGSLLNTFYDLKRSQGAWPEPGMVHARRAVFVRSFNDGGTRVDVYDYGNGQQASFHFYRDRIDVAPVRQ